MKNNTNKAKKDTSWGNVAEWYDKHLNEDNTYHSQVILPNILRVVDLQSNEAMLELGCGQGFFLDKFSSFSKKLTGVDLGKKLIEKAQEREIKAEFVFASADDENILKGKTFDVITIILALQNMKNIAAVAKNVQRLLKPNGRVCIVLNHPSFRIPGHSAWGMDKEPIKLQYRRVDSYMSEFEAKIDMTPGKQFKKEFTQSYHRPLQVYVKFFAKEGFAVTKLEEWISHRKSENGPWSKAENIARKEIPLFMCLVFKKIN